MILRENQLDYHVISSFHPEIAVTVILVDGRFSLAHHGAGLTFHGNCEGRTSPSANLSANILRIAISILCLFHQSISAFACRLALQRRLLLPSLSVPGHNPHPHLPPLPSDNHVENPPRSLRRRAVSRPRVLLAGALSGICVPRRRVSLGGYHRLWRASNRQFGWMGNLGRRAKLRAK